MRLSLLAIALLGIGLSACGSTMDRLSQVGQTPKLTAIENPTAQPGYKPVQMPMPTVQPVAYSPNSLWQSGSRTFFKDQRARNVGDILTIKVSISDKAAFDNSSERSRTSSDSTGVGGALVLLTGRIWAAVLLHITYNAVFVALALVGTLFG